MIRNKFKKCLKLLMLFYLLVYSSSALAQADLSSKELREKILNTITDYKNNDFEVMRVEVGEIKQGKSVSVFRELSKDKTYEIRLISLEDEVRDLMLRVYKKEQDGKWKPEIFDVNNLPGARVRFVSTGFYLYEISIEGYQFNRTKKSKYALVIALIN